MKVVQADRNFFYNILSLAFNNLQIEPAIVELGVLNGVNARQMKEALNPRFMALIDAWSCDIFHDYRAINAGREWVDPIDTFDEYFGGGAF